MCFGFHSLLLVHDWTPNPPSSSQDDVSTIIFVRHVFLLSVCACVSCLFHAFSSKRSKFNKARFEFSFFSNPLYLFVLYTSSRKSPSSIRLPSSSPPPLIFLSLPHSFTLYLTYTCSSCSVSFMHACMPFQ